MTEKFSGTQFLSREECNQSQVITARLFEDTRRIAAPKGIVNRVNLSGKSDSTRPGWLPPPY